MPFELINSLHNEKISEMLYQSVIVGSEELCCGALGNDCCGMCEVMGCLYLDYGNLYRNLIRKKETPMHTVLVCIYWVSTID